jgi:hypothetical protein
VYGAIENTTLSGGGAAPGVAQHSQKEGGHPLQLLAGPTGDLTIGHARCSHGAISRHRKPQVFEALKALMILEEGLQPRQEMQQHAQMHRVEQVGLGQIGNGAVGKISEGNGAGVNPVGRERRHVLRGIPCGILAVVRGAGHSHQMHEP